MAGSLKTLGLREIKSFRRRVLRQHSMERISRPDRDVLIELTDQLEERVTNMDEKGGEDDD